MPRRKYHWTEMAVGLGWLTISVFLMEGFHNLPQLVSALQPMTSFLLSDTSIFSGWNRHSPFDTPEAKTLTAVFLLLVPAQIATLFMLARESVCPRAQVKGIAAFSTIMAVVALIQPLVFLWGLSINGPLRIFGKNSSLGVAATIFIVTMAFSYLVRMIPVLLAMLSEHEKAQRN